MRDGGPAAAAREFVLYTAASFAALVVDYGTYWLLAALAGLDLGIAAVLGYALGLGVSYVLLTRRVFTRRRLAGRRAVEVGLFGLSGLVGLVITYVTVSVLHAAAGADLHGAKLAAVGLSFVAVYLFRKLVVFAPPGEATEQPEGRTPARALREGAGPPAATSRPPE